MAIWLSLVTALSWGFAEVLMIGAAKRHGPVVLGWWLMVAGAVMTVPLAVGGIAPSSRFSDWGVAGAAAAVGLVGSLLYWVALDRGSLAIVSPIVATSGGAGALLALLFLGDRLGPLSAIGMAIATAGVVLASFSRVDGRSGAAWAVPAALSLGGYTVLLAAASERVGAEWALVAYRVVGIAGLGLLVVVRRADLRLDRRQAGILLAAAALDTVGFVAFTRALVLGPVSVVAVISAQFSTIAVVLAATTLRERLATHQWIGVGALIVATTIIGAAQ